jgi:hypothetical protein
MKEVPFSTTVNAEIGKSAARENSTWELTPVKVD